MSFLGSTKQEMWCCGLLIKMPCETFNKTIKGDGIVGDIVHLNDKWNGMSVYQFQSGNKATFRKLLFFSATLMYSHIKEMYSIACMRSFVFVPHKAFYSDRVKTVARRQNGINSKFIEYEYCGSTLSCLKGILYKCVKANLSYFLSISMYSDNFSLYLQ